MNTCTQLQVARTAVQFLGAVSPQRVFLEIYCNVEEVEECVFRVSITCHTMNGVSHVTPQASFGLLEWSRASLMLPPTDTRCVKCVMMPTLTFTAWQQVPMVRCCAGVQRWHYLKNAIVKCKSKFYQQSIKQLSTRMSDARNCFRGKHTKKPITKKAFGVYAEQVSPPL